MICEVNTDQFSQICISSIRSISIAALFSNIINIKSVSCSSGQCFYRQGFKQSQSSTSWKVQRAITIIIEQNIRRVVQIEKSWEASI